MKATVAIPITILSIALLGLLTLLGVAANFFSHDPILRDILTWAGRLWGGSCAALPLFIVAALGVGLWRGAQWLSIQASLVYHRRGQLPASANPKITILAAHRNERAEIAQAIFGGKVDRANGSGMNALLAPRPDEEILQLAQPARSITSSEVLDGYDPQREPHWLLIGQTGSGKSHGVFAITQAITQRYNSQFLIAERGGIDWNRRPTPGRLKVTPPCSTRLRRNASAGAN